MDTGDVNLLQQMYEEYKKINTINQQLAAINSMKKRIDEQKESLDEERENVRKELTDFDYEEKNNNSGFQVVVPNPVLTNSIEYTGRNEDYRFSWYNEEPMIRIPRKEYDDLKANQKDQETENTCMIFIEKMARFLALKEMAEFYGLDSITERHEQFDSEHYNELYDKHYDFIFSFQCK